MREFHTLIPIWVVATAEEIATVLTFIAFAIYAGLFRWYKSAIGRHRFALYLSVLAALALTWVNHNVGFYRGSLIIATVVFLSIAVVMAWSVIQMLRKPKEGDTRVKKHSGDTNTRP